MSKSIAEKQNDRTNMAGILVFRTGAGPVGQPGGR
jgi:hypothetical protein